MNSQDDQIIVPTTRPDGEPTALSNRELLARILTEASTLVREEIELARAELIADLKSEARVATALGTGAILALCGLNLALVTVVLALSLVLPGWAAGLIMTGLVLTAAGVIAAVGWRRRVRAPLERTRKHLKEDVRFVKERLV
jgi:hypothetical protein